MAKAVRCLNCGQMSGKHSFPGFHCPDHTNKGAFLADQTMQSDIGIPFRGRLLDALGWQGGTVADALAEVRRLKADNLAMWQTLDGIANADWREWSELATLEAFEAWARSRARSHTSRQPLGQGVAALLPEHGEVKRGRRCKRDGKYLVAGSLNQVPYDGHGEPMLFSDEQCVSLDRLGYDVEPSHGAWS